MKANHQLALIVSYYLSRCDRDGYVNLGYSSFNEATKNIGEILDVKVNTIKNMRDEFDPYHENTRVGWLRELRGSRLKVLESFQDTDDNTLLEIVRGILFDHDFRKSDEYKEIGRLFEEKDSVSDQKRAFVLRGPTGKKAELAFIEFFNSYKKPIAGTLIDRRDEGCGYDFEIVSQDKSVFIEVKGLAAESGGILFTNKEWQIASKNQDNYYVVLVSNLSDVPEFKFIQNPAGKLKARKNIYTTVQLNWSVTDKDLRDSTDIL
jgi:hypothetical protein